jgi:hypothetical protein
MPIIFLLRDKTTGDFRRKDGSYAQDFAQILTFETKATAEAVKSESDDVIAMAGDTHMIGNG